MLGSFFFAELPGSLALQSHIKYGTYIPCVGKGLCCFQPIEHQVLELSKLLTRNRGPPPVNDIDVRRAAGHLISIQPIDFSITPRPFFGLV